MLKRIFIFAAPVALAMGAVLSSPAHSQASSYVPGDYWETTMIQLTDGQEEAYMDFLAGEWRRNYDFMKAKGWISEYHILTNTHPRAGEANMYILTRFKKMYSAEEQAAQQKEYEAFAKKDARRMTEESGKRAVIRKVIGGQLFQELVLK